MLSQYLPLVQTDYDKDKLEYLYSAYYPLMFSVAMKGSSDMRRFSMTLG